MADNNDYDPTDLPPALSAEERAELSVYAPGGDRALALVDALTALGAQQAAQIVLDGQRISELEAERYEQEQRGNNYCEATMAAEQKLAAANALLARIVKYATEDRATTPGTTRLARALVEAETRLAGQPAAPARQEGAA